MCFLKKSQHPRLEEARNEKWAWRRILKSEEAFQRRRCQERTPEQIQEDNAADHRMRFEKIGDTIGNAQGRDTDRSQDWLQLPARGPNCDQDQPEPTEDRQQDDPVEARSTDCLPPIKNLPTASVTHKQTYITSCFPQVSQETAEFLKGSSGM